MTTYRFPPVALPDHAFARDLQAFCLTFPGAWEDYPWGEIVYKVGAKMFGATGPSLPLEFTMKATKDDAEFLTQPPHISRARYIGQHGWVTVHVADASTLEQAKDLIATSYQPVATKKRRRPD
jgi:predicted DNA-binding protein (MmcQ/YjbR family)